MATTSLCNTVQCRFKTVQGAGRKQQRCYRQGERLLSYVLLHRGARPRQALLCRASVDQNTRAEVERASKEVLAEEVTEGAPFADSPGDEIENSESDIAKKKAEADRLRAAEKFMVVGTGEATCPGCGYEYRPKAGDSEYPVTPGTLFQDLPRDWQCPICGAEKAAFQSKAREIAGFAENQRYGLGTNSMTSGQKGALIWGSLLAFFGLFIAGYFVQ